MGQTKLQYEQKGANETECDGNKAFKKFVLFKYD